MMFLSKSEYFKVGNWSLIFKFYRTLTEQFNDGEWSMNRFVLLMLGVLILAQPAMATEVVVDVNLSPAGSFKAKTDKIKGVVKKTADGFVADQILVSSKSLKTGIELRDKHTLERLQADKFPVISLVKAEGKNGKGSGVIKIMGIEKNIQGTYSVKGKDIIAVFPLKLSDFKITGIRYMGVGVKDEVKVTVTLPVQ